MVVDVATTVHDHIRLAVWDDPPDAAKGTDVCVVLSPAAVRQLIANLSVATGQRQGIQRGAATALIFEMLERAIAAQRQGGTAVKVITELDEQTARAIGLWGEGMITLEMEPAFGQRPGDLRLDVGGRPLPPLPERAYSEEKPQ